jgi:hypothetical protein
VQKIYAIFGGADHAGKMIVSLGTQHLAAITDLATMFRTVSKWPK